MKIRVFKKKTYKRRKAIKPHQIKVRQTKKGIRQDSAIKAHHAGRQVSKRKKVYYEYRSNRTDLKGNL